MSHKSCVLVFRYLYILAFWVTQVCSLLDGYERMEERAVYIFRLEAMTMGQPVFPKLWQSAPVLDCPM
jgi:hypothetical protein